MEEAKLAVTAEGTELSVRDYAVPEWTEKLRSPNGDSVAEHSVFKYSFIPQPYSWLTSLLHRICTH